MSNVVTKIKGKYNRCKERERTKWEENDKEWQR